VHIALVLTAGPAKEVGIIMSRPTSRSLLRLPGRTLLEHIISALTPHVDEIVVAYDDDQVPSLCRELGCRALDVEPGGIIVSLCQAISKLMLSGDDMVTVVYGDVYGEPDLYKGHVAAAEQVLEPLVTAVKPTIVRGGYLRLNVTEDGLVDNVGSGGYIFGGLVSLTAAQVNDLCKLASIERYFTLLASKGRLRARLWLSVWVDIDTPWDYMVAVRHELSRLHGLHISEGASVAESAELEPPLVVEAGARIDSNAVLRGPAYISQRALVGAFSFVRAGSMVLEGATIGAYTEVKRSIVCRGAYIGSHSYVADSIIGEYASLSPYTVTRNIPYTELPQASVLLTTTHPLERLKVGAVVAANARTKPHSVLEPGAVYS
jgi:NDP-sugar pyrophosphorylase family protein